MQSTSKRIHFIAIGGSVMHNLAIALRNAGHQISGSDDEIYEPSKSVLATHNLLPAEEGWFPDKLNGNIDAVIVGMHAHKDNPELLRAQELGLTIFSFPEFIYQHAINKQRIVIAGSHGKTTITAMIIHVLNYFNRSFDYVIGSKVKGIEQAVKLTDAPIIIIEGDEYFSSPLDPTPKFLRYQHHMGVISGIAWDHANVFPTEEEYVRQFDLFADQTPKGGILIYNDPDPMSLMIGKKERADVLEISYKSHTHSQDNDSVFLTNGKERFPVKFFGNHNFQNVNAAKEVLKKIGISPEQFYEAIQSFEGAAGRLELLKRTSTSIAYKDFAHAPSKLRATVKAVKDLYPKRELIACFELHTYSSLSKKFLPQYKDAFKGTDIAAVYYNPEKVKAKNLDAISEDDIKKAFAHASLNVFTDTRTLADFLLKQSYKNKNLLMMSSGNFGGLDIKPVLELMN